MRQRIFLSFEHPQQLGPSGFDLAAHKDLAFRGRHLAEASKRDDPQYVKDQVSRSAVTVVLIGSHASENKWLRSEIEWSLEKGNGLVGILLDPAASTPVMLHEAGAEILNWRDPEDVGYLKAAIDAAARSAALLRRAARHGTGAGESCARPTARFPD